MSETELRNTAVRAVRRYLRDYRKMMDEKAGMWSQCDDCQDIYDIYNEFIDDSDLCALCHLTNVAEVLDAALSPNRPETFN